MSLTGGLVLTGIMLFAGASFFFALAETALLALGKTRARLITAPAGAEAVRRLFDLPHEFLAALVFGNTLANGAIVALALWPALHGAWSPWAALAGAAALILVGCEIVPKTLAVRAPERWALRVARPMLALMRATGWLQRLFERITHGLLRALVPASVKPLPAVAEEEYKELVDLAFQQGTLAQSEKETILQIIHLDRKTAKDVMKPRARMAAIADDLSVEEMVAAARQFKHRRLPIYDESPDTIVGILNTELLLLDPQADLADAIEFPSSVPESMNLLQLLKSLQQQRRGLAIVVDEFGGTAGVVTVEDILEEVVGPIRSEAEPVEFIVEKLGPGRWRVNGLTQLEDFRREYPELADVPEVDTMGGWMVQAMEVVPAAGETVAVRGLKLTAQVVDDRRVRELLVETVRRR